ncbi:MAG: hypothetical protein J0L93_03410 [Deltaproteobacteria bacterium]|nr:hypothetical protein [Deltaproteobacteria bacterium]
MLDPNFESYPFKILKSLGLEKEYRDKYKTSEGMLVLEKISSKDEIEVPFELVELIQKHRGYMQLAALEEFKKLIFAFDKDKSRIPGKNRLI